VQGQTAAGCFACGLILFVALVIQQAEALRRVLFHQEEDAGIKCFTLNRDPGREERERTPFYPE
jgi:hypothetical protein